jgi:hypothetical protein
VNEDKSKKKNSKKDGKNSEKKDEITNDSYSSTWFPGNGNVH